MNKKRQYTCEVCKDLFVDFASRKRRFCSAKCSKIARPNKRKKSYVKLVCTCGRTVSVRKYKKLKYCSRECSNKYKMKAFVGKNNPCWKGGYVGKNGYHYTRINGKYELTHRVVYEEEMGEIPRGMFIHHKDENKLNNKVSNLELISPAAHASLHVSSFTEKEALKMREIYRKGDTSHRELAKIYKVDKSCISRTLKRLKEKGA